MLKCESVGTITAKKTDLIQQAEVLQAGRAPGDARGLLRDGLHGHAGLLSNDHVLKPKVFVLSR